MNPALANRSSLPSHVSTVSAFSLALREKLSPLFETQPFKGLENGTSSHSSPASECTGLIKHHSHCSIGIGLTASTTPAADENWSQTALPEIHKILVQQAQMVWEIGKSLQVKEELLRNELIISILLLSTGGTPEECSFFPQEKKLILRRCGPNAHKLLLVLLTEKVAEGLFRSLTPGLFPSVVPATIAAWGYCLSLETGRQAQQMLSREFVSEETPKNRSLARSTGPMGSSDNARSCDFEKLKILAQLLLEDHAVDDRLFRIVSLLMKGLHLSEEEEHAVQVKLTSSRHFRINYQVFRECPDRARDLIMDLIGVALEDHKISLPESRFIMDIACQFGLQKEETEHLLAEAGRAAAFNARYTLSRGG